MPYRTPVGASDGRLLTGSLTTPNRLQGESLTRGVLRTTSPRLVDDSPRTAGRDLHLADLARPTDVVAPPQADVAEEGPSWMR